MLIVGDHHMLQRTGSGSDSGSEAAKEERRKRPEVEVPSLKVSIHPSSVDDRCVELGQLPVYAPPLGCLVDADAIVLGAGTVGQPTKMQAAA